MPKNQPIRTILFSVMTLCLLAGTIPAQTKGAGVGVILGKPTGLSCKFWRQPGVALATAVAWSLGNNGVNTHVHVDYLLHIYDFSTLNDTDLFLHYGLGLRFKVATATRIGIRIPVGCNFPFRKCPVGIFVELAPILDLLPSTGFDVNAAVGSRFYF